jgi:hypothetical protein
MADHALRVASAAHGAVIRKAQSDSISKLFPRQARCVKTFAPPSFRILP